MGILSTIFRSEKYIKQAEGYEKMSEWQLAKDVEFDDGQNGETKLGVIDGITSDINGESDKMAASIKLVNEINTKIGTWIGSSTVESGSTSVVIENAAITADSLIDVYYAEDSKETVQNAGVTYSQAAGSLTLTFGSALAAAVTISNVKVVNV